MKLVIDISEDDYRKVQDGRASVSMMRKAIRNGTPLPKGHGRLIDADAMTKEIQRWKDHPNKYIRNRNKDFIFYLNNEETVIEADKESEDKE